MSVGKPIVIDGKRVIVVSLENYTSDFIQGIALEVPAVVPLSAFVSDSPVQLTEPSPPYPAGTRLVSVGHIPPRLVSRLFITWPQSLSDAAPRIVNSSASGVRIRHENELESPLKSALITAAIVAAAYAAISAALAAYAKREIGIVREDIDRLKGEIERKSKISDELRNSIQKVEARVAKQRLLLMARLTDYSKELNFWRNAVSKLLLAKGADIKTANELIESVTEALGTHGTKQSPRDFEAVQVAAAWLAEAERADLRSSSSGNANAGNVSSEG